MSNLLVELGGRDAVELVVAAFYERVLADSRLARFFQKVSMTRLQQLQVDFFCAALSDRPELYRGRDMRTAHAGMGISNADFDAVAAHLIAALLQVGVGQANVDRVIARVAPLRAHVVG